MTASAERRVAASSPCAVSVANRAISVANNATSTGYFLR
jgi:hypothetical protein